MALEVLSPDIESLILQVSSLTRLFQAIGGLIAVYVIFSIVDAIINKKKQKELKKINENLEDIKVLLKKKKIISKQLIFPTFLFLLFLI